MLALNVLCQYTKCHVLIVRDTNSEYAQRHRGRSQPHERGPMNSPAPRALALRTTGVTYPGSPEQISAVRADMRSLLRGCPMADDVILCASELAANAAIHSHSRLPGGTFTVRPRISPGDYAWIEVEDNGGPWDSCRQGPKPAPRARHRPRQRIRHRRRPGRPHHLGPIRLDRVMAVRLNGHAARWSAVIDGQRLRELRLQRVLSQVELARLAGVSARSAPARGRTTLRPARPGVGSAGRR
jgi:anti-sigma regulatory factor (Ser/Thr protein kinase)